VKIFLANERRPGVWSGVGALMAAAPADDFTAALEMVEKRTRRAQLSTRCVRGLEAIDRGSRTAA
jgi:hypothetical protein